MNTHIAAAAAGWQQKASCLSGRLCSMLVNKEPLDSIATGRCTRAFLKSVRAARWPCARRRALIRATLAQTQINHTQ